MADTIHVIVGGEASNKLVWDSVVAMLDKVADIEPHTLQSDVGPDTPTDEVDELVERYNANVLIVVSDAEVSRETFRHYWLNNTELVVIGIESDGQETIIRLETLGGDMLAELIRSVARLALPAGEDEPDTQSRGSVHVLDTEKFKRLADQAGRRLTSGLKDDVSTDTHFADVLRWIEVCLHRYLDGLANEDGNHDSTPGWTVSPRKARQLFGGRHAGDDAKELEQAQMRLEHELSRQVAYGEQRSAWFRIYDVFQLNEIQRQMLWLTTAADVDGRFATVFGVINDDLTRRRPSATTLARLLYGSARQAIDLRRMIELEGPFTEFGLLESEPESAVPRSEAAVRVPTDILDFVSDAGIPFSNYAGQLRVSENVRAPEFLGESTHALRTQVAGWRKIGKSDDVLAPVLHLNGGDEALSWFERAACEAECPVVVFNAASLAESTSTMRRRQCLAACRIALMHSAALVVTGRNADSDVQQRRLDELMFEIAGPRVELLVLHGTYPVNGQVGRSVHETARGHLSIVERAAIWRDRARLRGITLPRDLSEDIAATVRFEEPQIDSTLALCSGKYITIEQIKAAARRVATGSIPIGARRIEPCFTFDDLVLDDDIKNELKLIPLQVQHSRAVMEDWDFQSRMPYGNGVTALFSGPSGTGKTMASQIIANAVGVSCMRIDLSQCRSKWYGESEERIGEVFDAAERSCAVLQIEEADAMFRARSGDHDRQGQSEVAFLLDRMEAYSGVAILTTNKKESLDTSFLRRLRFVVNFPAPGYEQRVELWHKVFPSLKLLDEDVDFDFLARRLELTGGNIQQIAVRAAFLAATSNSLISMEHIYRATRQELRKLGMQSAEKKIAELAA